MGDLFSGMRVLVVAPHTDDEVNCAGTLIEAEEADKLIFACSPCYESVPPGYPSDILIQEAKKSAHMLQAEFQVEDWPVRQFSKFRQEILERLVIINEVYKPDVVLVPSSTDLHQDHQVVHAESMRAFRNVRLLLGWESPNNQRVSYTNYFVPISETTLDKKIRTQACYKSQEFRKHLDLDFFKALAIVRGRQARTMLGLAEAFETLNVRA